MCLFTTDVVASQPTVTYMCALLLCASEELTPLFFTVSEQARETTRSRLQAALGEIAEGSVDLSSAIEQSGQRSVVHVEARATGQNQEKQFAPTDVKGMLDIAKAASKMCPQDAACQALVLPYSILSSYNAAVRAYQESHPGWVPKPEHTLHSDILPELNEAYVRAKYLQNSLSAMTSVPQVLRQHAEALKRSFGD